MERTKKEWEMEALLPRDAICPDLVRSAKLLRGKRVLVTGAAGSIGSELCRQALLHQVSELTAFDIDENGLFYLGREMEEENRLHLTLGSVRDRARLDEVMEEYRPELVLHAAAHKHVPMMEGSPKEAIKNNVLGTLYTGLSAIEHRVERMVLISTDKAVHPTSVMGATKQLAEQIVQGLNQTSPFTRLCGVRFGNVLGSSGSVVPIFQQQIAEGGPVTITHPQMRRFFMTIPEAVELVLEAAALSHGGEMFLLKMGQPVRIYDLACQMIHAAGMEPGRDISIEFTGVRPGEKLREELCLPQENLLATAHERVLVSPAPQLEVHRLFQGLVDLTDALEQPGCQPALQQLAGLVPTARMERLQRE